jgi:hypothetical protein
VGNSSSSRTNRIARWANTRLLITNLCLDSVRLAGCSVCTDDPVQQDHVRCPEVLGGGGGCCGDLYKTCKTVHPFCGVIWLSVSMSYLSCRRSVLMNLVNGDHMDAVVFKFVQLVLGSPVSDLIHIAF